MAGCGVDRTNAKTKTISREKAASAAQFVSRIPAKTAITMTLDFCCRIKTDSHDLARVPAACDPPLTCTHVNMHGKTCQGLLRALNLDRSSARIGHRCTQMTNAQ